MRTTRVPLFRRCVTYLLLGALVGCEKNKTTVDLTSDARNAFLKQVNGSPEDVMKRSKSKTPKGKTEYFTLTLACYLTENFDQALINGRSALAMCSKLEEKELCYQVLAQSEGAQGHFQKAYELATEGAKISPRSKELAALRVAYARAAHDNLSVEMAEEHLKQVDPTYDRKNIMEPLTGIVIIVSVICFAEVAKAGFAACAKDPEVGKEIAKSLSHLVDLGTQNGMLAVIH